MTRIGDLAQNRYLSGLILAAQTRVYEGQVAVSSGKAVRRFSDVGGETPLLAAAKDSLTRLDRHIKDNELVVERLRMMDGALDNLVQLAERLRTLLIQRLNATSADDPALNLDSEGMFALEVERMHAEAVAQLNTAFNGRYLFAGSRTDAPPVVLDQPITDTDPARYYRGDSIRLSVRADARLEVPYGITADRPAFGELLAAMGSALAGNAGDRQQLEHALEQAGRAIEGLADLRGENGTVMHRLEAANDGHRGTLLYLNETVSRIEDTDLAAALSRLLSDQATLEAALTVVGRLSRLSLADYLR